MSQNIYDDPDFFAGYKRLRDTGSGLNDVLEQPALRSLLPPLAGLSVLELGCGMGQFSRCCAQQGAAEVVATDISENMLGVARRENADPRIEYVRAAMEELAFPDRRFDLVVSSLALHYIEDYVGLVQRVSRWLQPGGRFVYSVEHPIATADRAMAGWEKDAQGNRLFWRVDDYGDEGQRTQTWFVSGVVKYHRTLATLLNGLVAAGLRIEQVLEPEAVPEAVQERPALADERRRTPFLLVKARKD